LLQSNNSTITKAYSCTNSISTNITRSYHVLTQYTEHSSPNSNTLLQAGVIGLACARAAAQAGLEVVLLEQEASYGTATSSRHSEVIHAGIYYPAGEQQDKLAALHTLQVQGCFETDVL
jgi:heterodisulfide reductase subunit A-like polyferredoxin